MAEPTQYSEELAAFYEASHEYGDVGDERFYLDAAMEADGPVLEGACGTGRLYLELLRRGVDADGVDISRPMLAVLREQAAAEDLEPTVWQADLRSVAAARTYELVYIPYNSFCVLRSVDDQLAALASMHDLLAPGGRLLFDVYVPRYDLIASSYDEWQDRGSVASEDRTLSGRSRATVVDQVNQIYRTEQELLDEEGTVVARQAFHLSHLPPQQVELLARQSPFAEWSVSGGFDGDPLTDGDGIQVWELTA